MICQYCLFLYFLNVIPFFDTWAGTCDLTVWINVFAFFSYIFKYRPLPHLWSLFFCQKLSRIWCTFTKSHGDLSLWERERSAQSTIAHIACVLSATISSSDPIILASLVEKLMLLSWHTNANLYTPAIRTNHSYDMFFFFFIEKRTCFSPYLLI